MTHHKKGLQFAVNLDPNTMKLGFNKPGNNEHSVITSPVITNTQLQQTNFSVKLHQTNFSVILIDISSSQIYLVVTNPGYNEQKLRVVR